MLCAGSVAVKAPLDTLTALCAAKPPEAVV
jgi:hypothetical protein